jgi:hypothetical protein
VQFSDSDSIKNIGFKIFKDLKETMKDVFCLQPHMVEILSQADVKQAYDACFVQDIEAPY